MIDAKILNWLLDNDFSIQFQVYRDLLNTYRPDLKEKISKYGWGRKFLSFRNINGHWGLGFYKPKWTSSHYNFIGFKKFRSISK